MSPVPEDRDRTVRKPKDLPRLRFNASFAEVIFQDKWQRAILDVCVVDSDMRLLE